MVAQLRTSAERVASSQQKQHAANAALMGSESAKKATASEVHKAIAKIYDQTNPVREEKKTATARLDLLFKVFDHADDKAVREGIKRELFIKDGMNEKSAKARSTEIGRMYRVWELRRMPKQAPEIDKALHSKTSWDAMLQEATRILDSVRKAQRKSAIIAEALMMRHAADVQTDGETAKVLTFTPKEIQAVQTDPEIQAKLAEVDNTAGRAGRTEQTPEQAAESFAARQIGEKGKGLEWVQAFAKHLPKAIKNQVSLQQNREQEAEARKSQTVEDVDKKVKRAMANTKRKLEAKQARESGETEAAA
jgi:hypothetical protein